MRLVNVKPSSHDWLVTMRLVNVKPTSHDWLDTMRLVNVKPISHDWLDTMRLVNVKPTSHDWLVTMRLVNVKPTSHDWLVRNAKYKIIYDFGVKKEGRKEMFYLTMHSIHFIYSFMVSDIWKRTIHIAREETRCRHMGYCFRLAARVLLYAPSHRQDSTYHDLCCTSRGALAGTRNSSIR